jgi:hypothetical protein
LGFEISDSIYEILRDKPGSLLWTHHIVFIQNAIDTLNQYNNLAIDLYINTYNIIRTLYSNLSC